jgi:hypothetical protein
MAGHSTAPKVRRKRTGRPPKPYPGFPLHAHASGHWAKKIRGRLIYFGRWQKRENGRMIPLADGGNWKGALADYRSRIDDLQAGRLPRPQTCDSDVLRINELCNRFLIKKSRRVESGEPPNSASNSTAMQPISKHSRRPTKTLNTLLKETTQTACIWRTSTIWPGCKRA